MLPVQITEPLMTHGARIVRLPSTYSSPVNSELLPGRIEKLPRITTIPVPLSGLLELKVMLPASATVSEFLFYRDSGSSRAN